MDVQCIEGWDEVRFLRGEISLDKDLKNKKLYSKETCVWLSREDNFKLKGNNKYYAISPQGIKYEFNIIQDFCLEHSLNYSTFTKRLNGDCNNPYYRGWYIPKQKESNYTPKFRYEPPFFVKDINTLEELQFDSIESIAEFLNIKKGRYATIRDAINPNKKSSYSCQGYLIRSSNTHYKEYKKIYYIRKFPDGKEEIIHNLSKYCKGNKLNLTCVSECVNGKQKTHKKSEFYKIETKIS